MPTKSKAISKKPKKAAAKTAVAQKFNIDSVLKAESDIFVSIKIGGDKEITQLNKKFFNRDYTTDVLSFPVEEKMEDGSFYLGDILVNKEQAARQAKEYDNDLKQELVELAAHGMLHLLGIHHPHDDEEDIHGIKPVL